MTPRILTAGIRPVQSSLGAIAIAAAAVLSGPAHADEGGVSFWIPGFFGSLAAAPQAPGWTQQVTYYHTSVSAGADVALAREFTLKRIPVNLTLQAGLSANVNAKVDLALAIALYTLDTPILGGQFTMGMMAAYGRNDTTLNASLNGILGVNTPLGNLNVPFSRADTINSTVDGFGDLVPLLSLRWNNGVHNTMVYATGDIPVGAYDSNRLANLGIGHGAIDAGYGYTYFNPQTGHEFTAVLGFTYNLINQSTQYQNGVDMHLDWGASQFLTKQFMVGLVGYVYQELGCDSGSGDRVGCFRSRVIGAGPQVGFLFPVGELQGYLNLKGYREFDNANRPDGWNVWATLVISPPMPGPPSSAAPKRMITK